MAVQITGRPVTPEEVTKLLRISAEREQAIAELTGYRINEARSHAHKASAKKRTHKFSAKRSAKRR